MIYIYYWCWEDIFDVIWDVKYLIYIIGWFVYFDIILIRDFKWLRLGGNLKLGEVLKKKVDENVIVLMFVWDDRMFNEVFKRDGLMMIYD